MICLGGWEGKLIHLHPFIRTELYSKYLNALVVQSGDIMLWAIAVIRAINPCLCAIKDNACGVAHLPCHSPLSRVMCVLCRGRLSGFWQATIRGGYMGDRNSGCLHTCSASKQHAIALDIQNKNLFFIPIDKTEGARLHSLEASCGRKSARAKRGVPSCISLHPKSLLSSIWKDSLNKVPLPSVGGRDLPRAGFSFPLGAYHL